MPQTPYSKLFMSVNGGALTSGGVTAVHDDVVQLSPESTVGWDRPATVYQITAYPAGWSTPSGWTLNATSGYIEYYANGANGVTPPAITMPSGGDIASGVWGKWKFRLLVNGGGGQLTDADSGLLIVSPNLSLHSVARGERGEFGGAQRQWAGELQHDLKIIDGLANGGAPVPSSRTLTGSADIWIDGSASAKDLSENRAFTIRATTTAEATMLVRLNDSGGTGLNGIAVAATATWLHSQAASTTGAGASSTWSGQDAKTGAYSGGTIDFVTGQPGDNEHWGGDFRVGVSGEDANDGRSAFVSLYAAGGFGGAPFIKMNSVSSTGTIDGPSGLVITSSGGNVTISSSGGHSLNLSTKPTITGSKGGNVALANLLSALAGLGLIRDSTT